MTKNYSPKTVKMPKSAPVVAPKLSGAGKKTAKPTMSMLKSVGVMGKSKGKKRACKDMD